MSAQAPTPGFNRTFRRWMRHFIALLWGMTLGALLLAAFTAGSIYDYQDTVDGVHLPEVDAIVCLAGGRGRIAAAGDLWYRYYERAHVPYVGGVDPGARPVPTLYLSGMGHGSTWNAFARQLRRGVLDVIKPDRVVLETESTNTEANARYLILHARRQKWDKILLLTSSYHMKRAKFIFENVLRDEGATLKIETLSVYQDPFEPGEWRHSLHGVRVTLTEFLKMVFYQTFWEA